MSPTSVHTFEVPGAFELPLAAKLCAESGRFAGVACLGVVIRGETDHYDFVCSEAARGIQEVQLATGVPCAFGVITCDTREQAEARAGGDKRDQGRNAALAVLRMAELSGARSGIGRLEPLLPALCSRLPATIPARWPRSVTAAARGPRSGTRAATRWSPPGGASTRTCRRSGSTTAGARAASTSAPAA